MAVTAASAQDTGRTHADASAIAACEQSFKRISFVTIDLRGDAPECSVTGLGRRRPITQPVPLSTALALIRSGTPSVVKNPREGEA